MKKTNYKNTPNCLRKHRRARGLKQIEVTEILGLKKYYHDYSVDERRLSVKHNECF